MRAGLRLQHSEVAAEMKHGQKERLRVESWNLLASAIRSAVTTDHPSKDPSQQRDRAICSDKETSTTCCDKGNQQGLTLHWLGG